MNVSITVETDNYDDAKYILGAAALAQSVDEYTVVTDDPASVPVAYVLTRTAILALAWLHTDTPDDLLNVNDEMSVEQWALAFLNADRAKAIFLELVNTNERYKARYDALMHMAKEE